MKRLLCLSAIVLAAACSRSVPDIPTVPTTLPIPAPTEVPATSIKPLDPLYPVKATLACPDTGITVETVNQLLSILSFYDGENALDGPFPVSLRANKEIPGVPLCSDAKGVNIPVPHGTDSSEMGSAIRALIGARADADPGLPKRNSSNIWQSRGSTEIGNGHFYMLFVVPNDHLVGGNNPSNLSVWKQPMTVCEVEGKEVPCSEEPQVLGKCQDWWPWCF